MKRSGLYGSVRMERVQKQNTKGKKSRVYSNSDEACLYHKLSIGSALFCAQPSYTPRAYNTNVRNQ
ncbi:hypothetical protein QTP88_014441 [Uroleucon formosanum]